MRRNRTFIGPAGMGGMVSLWGQSSLIKSIQSGALTISNGSATGTATVSAVDMSNAVLFLVGQQSAELLSSMTDYLSRITLTNATTITGTRVGTTTVLTPRYALMEWMPGVLKSIQYLTIVVNAPSTSNTATITEVNPAKAVVLFLGESTNRATGITGQEFAFDVVLTNGTTVTATHGVGAGNWTVGAVVMECF